MLHADKKYYFHGHKILPGVLAIDILYVLYGHKMLLANILYISDPD